MRPMPSRAMHNRDTSDIGGDRRTSSLAGVIAVLLVLVVSLVVVRKLQVRVLMEGCMQTQSPSCEMAADRLRVSRLFDRFAAQ